MEAFQSSPYYITEEIYATNGQRFANFLIDYVLQIIIVIFGFATASILIDLIFGTTFSETISESSRVADYLWGILALLIYYGFSEVLLGRSIAKYITKTVVVDENGNPPEKRKLLLRTICRCIPFDAFSFLGTPCRGWHDSISDTYVVQKELLQHNKETHYSFEEIGKPEGF